MPNIDTSRFAAIEPLEKGWSSDKKFIVTTHTGERQLLRVSDMAELARKRDEFEMLGRVEALGVPASRPLAFWTENDCVCQLLSWMEGESAEVLLPTLSAAEQYALGLQAGEILRKIHSIPAPDDIEEWAIVFERKVNNWLDMYHTRPEVHSATGENIVRYLHDHKDILLSLPISFIHGDFHYENIVVTPDGKVGVIDFSSFNTPYGSSWWDFNQIAWMTVHYPYFYSGQVNGYFSDKAPEKFWRVLSYYMAYDALAALTDPYELNGIEDGVYVVNNILKWTDNFTRIVPTWYQPPIPAPPTLQPIQSEKDVSELSQMAQAITREYFIPILGKENANFCADNYCTPAVLAEEIANGNAAYFIVDHMERVGYVQYRLQEDCLFIDKLYLLPAYRHRGIGARVIRILEDIAISSDRKLLRLEANKCNTAAIAFYERVGFAVAGECEDNDGSVWDTCFLEKIAAFSFFA